ncbi:DUF3857 domain-containing protein [Flavobacterium kingsejongi]|uniref:Transglutaminase n=1 Tax=Flavobacterium kingsejongi TaxID=1678728 RepID=A0A2S1LN44_9FLAO|nr:DUF3857 domain-containing protein [Flavobacterium kingsejongi]AWG25172.1 transglutaminase [Flavobacterium kingsejongi]
MKHIYLIIGLFLVGLNLTAQKFDLGKVTTEEVSEKVHPKDTAAVAAYLFKDGRTYFEWDGEGHQILVTEVKSKIKIYKKEGYHWANHSIAYYVGGSNKEKVSFSDVAVYNLENGKVVKSKMKSDGEFMEEVNPKWKVRKITLPNVREGSVVEYSYVIRSPFIVAFPIWEFQYKIPVNLVNYNVNLPSIYIYNSSIRGGLAPKITKSNGIGTSKTVESKTNYLLENVPALKDERYVNNIRNYTSLIQHELASAKSANGTITNYAQSWDDVVKNIYDDTDFGQELNYKSYFEEDINAIIAKAGSKDEKINLIFDYVKNRMNWNEINSYSCEKGVKKAYKDKVGNAAEINLMLTAMLRYAGIGANPIILSTRSNGIAFFPSRTAFNYVICGVEIDNGIIFLDATSKNTQPNILPSRALNWFGRIIRENKSSAEVSLDPKLVSKETVSIIATMDDTGKITGKARDQYSEYNAYNFRENFAGLSKDSYVEKLEKKYSGIEIDDYTTTNEKDLTLPVIENFSFGHSGLVEHIGNKIYFSPLLHYTIRQNPFTQETREYPVDFRYPYQDRYLINITIPKGYEVESLPAPISLTMEENIGNFKYNIISSGEQIQLKVSFDMNYSNVSPEYYETLKNFYKGMIEKQNEKVVLKKV